MAEGMQPTDDSEMKNKATRKYNAGVDATDCRVLVVCSG
jgi:hypothetical protein